MRIVHIPGLIVDVTSEEEGLLFEITIHPVELIMSVVFVSAVVLVLGLVTEPVLNKRG